MNCPNCGAIQRGPIDGKRIFFACDSYGSTDDGKLRDQTDLCSAWETLNKNDEQWIARESELMAKLEKCRTALEIISQGQTNDHREIAREALEQTK